MSREVRRMGVLGVLLCVVTVSAYAWPGVVSYVSDGDTGYNPCKVAKRTRCD